MSFEALSDKALTDMLHLHFGIIIGAIEPVAKAKPNIKKPEKVIPFSEFSFINVMVFRNCFTIASQRGILSPAEIIAGNEILAITG